MIFDFVLKSPARGGGAPQENYDYNDDGDDDDDDDDDDDYISLGGLRGPFFYRLHLLVLGSSNLSSVEFRHASLTTHLLNHRPLMLIHLTLRALPPPDLNPSF